MDGSSLSPEGGVIQTDEFQALQLYCSEDEQQWSLPISARLKVSLFGTDQATQTNITEIVELKKLTEVTQTMVKEIHFLKKDFEFSKCALKADYEQELQQRASELYTRMNDRLKDLERLHLEKIMRIRRSCMQQLADGLALIKGAYQNYYISGEQQYYFSRDDKDKKESTFANLSFANKYHDLLNKLQEKEATISVLKAQLQELENSTQIFSEQEEDPEKQRLEEENGDLKQKVNRLKKMTESTTDLLVLKEKEIKELMAEQSHLKSEYEKKKTGIEEKFLQQKLCMERDLETRLNAMKQEMQLKHERDMKKIEELEQDKYTLLEKQRRPSPLPFKELPPPVVKDISLNELNKVKKIEQEQRKHIESLKKQLDWTSRMWEKKFAILKQSLHAVKDEMFLRQTLQRQAAVLHQTSISYAVDAVVGTIPGVVQRDAAPILGYSLSGLPLPHIGSQSVPQMETKEVYSIRIPSGQGTDNFSGSESQIVSEDEEDLDEVLPLPSSLPIKKTLPSNLVSELIDAQT